MIKSTEKWWLQVAGSSKDDPTFDEAETIGKLWRATKTETETDTAANTDD